MQWQRKNGLKSNEILLLSYIYKYHRIDFADLQQELDLPRSAITLMVQKLYETGYINYSDESNKRMSMIITDKIDKKYVENWSQWTKVKEGKLEDEKDIFTDVLYVPEKFDTI